MVYVAEGRLELKIPSESFYVETGDAFVINSNVLHYAIAADYCKLHSLVFHPTLILGNEDSVCKKYVRPLVSCHAFSGCAVSRFENAHVIQWFAVRLTRSYRNLRDLNLSLGRIYLEFVFS